MKSLETALHYRRRVLSSFRRWRYGLKHVAATAYIGRNVRVFPDLKAGDYSFIGDQCQINPHVTIGKYVLVAPQVAIVGGDHRYDIPGMPIIFSGRDETKDTLLEDDCWIGFRSIVMCGVTIGRGAIIAAGSVVTKDVPPFEIYGGTPARKLRDRFSLPEFVERHRTMLDGPLVNGEYCERKGGSR
jgi:acetyltransferase-like isoleucine patch superfamily enzyme